MSKKGSVSIETVLLLVLVTLALVASLVALGNSMNKTVTNASSGISKETACGLIHGNYQTGGTGEFCKVGNTYYYNFTDGKWN